MSDDLEVVMLPERPRGSVRVRADTLPPQYKPLVYYEVYQTEEMVVVVGARKMGNQIMYRGALMPRRDAEGSLFNGTAVLFTSPDGYLIGLDSVVIRDGRFLFVPYGVDEQGDPRDMTHGTTMGSAKDELKFMHPTPVPFFEGKVGGDEWDHQIIIALKPVWVPSLDALIGTPVQGGKLLLRTDDMDVQLLVRDPSGPRRGIGVSYANDGRIIFYSNTSLPTGALAKLWLQDHPEEYAKILQFGREERADAYMDALQRLRLAGQRPRKLPKQRPEPALPVANPDCPLDSRVNEMKYWKSRMEDAQAELVRLRQSEPSDVNQWSLENAQFDFNAAESQLIAAHIAWDEQIQAIKATLLI